MTRCGCDAFRSSDQQTRRIRNNPNKITFPPTHYHPLLSISFHYLLRQLSDASPNKPYIDTPLSPSLHSPWHIAHKYHARTAFPYLHNNPLTFFTPLETNIAKHVCYHYNAIRKIISRVATIATFSSSLTIGARLVARLWLCMWIVIVGFACFEGLGLTIAVLLSFLILLPQAYRLFFDCSELQHLPAHQSPLLLPVYHPSFFPLLRSPSSQSAANHLALSPQPPSYSAVPSSSDIPLLVCCISISAPPSPSRWLGTSWYFL